MVESEQPQPPPEGGSSAVPRRRGGRRRGGRGRGRRAATPADHTSTEAGEPTDAREETQPSAAPSPDEGHDRPETAALHETPPESVEPAMPATHPAEPSPTPGRSMSRPRLPLPQRPDSRREPRPSQPAARNLLREVQRQVRDIIESLQQSLEEMESVQRLLDQVEQERSEDLRELESLRRSLDVLRTHRSGPRYPAYRPPSSAPASASSGPVDAPEEPS